MKNLTRLTNEHFTYSLIFLLALFLRLLLLGRVPLVEGEANWAYQAWLVMLGESPLLGSQVSYLSLTEQLFALFGGGNFQARFWPALAGSLIVWAPLFFRDRLGRVPALVLAGGLALDPALVSVSRIAGSPMPALAFLALAGAAFHLRRRGWFLIMLFVGLFSGASFWLGLLGLGAGLLLGSWLGVFDGRTYFLSRLGLLADHHGAGRWRLEDLALPGLIIIAVGTFFFSNLQGVSAWLGSLPAFFRGWGSSTGFRALEVLLHLGISSPLIVIFGVAGFVFAWRRGQQLNRLASLWFAASLLLLLAYPGRQEADLIWLVVPLWISAAGELVRVQRLVRGSWPVYGLAGLIGALLILNWLTFTGMVFQIGNQRAVLLQWGLIAASLALVLLAMTIVGSEWGWLPAKKGLAWGLASMLLVYTVSAMVQGAYLRAGDPRSLWSDGSGAGQMDLLLESVGEIGLTQTGRKEDIQVALLRGSDSLKWALRDLEGLEFLDTYHTDALYPVVITSELESYLVPEQNYRGQDFVLATRPGWNGLVPPDWISWIAFRSGPIESDRVILWVRGDIITGY